MLLSRHLICSSASFSLMFVFTLLLAVNSGSEAKVETMTKAKNMYTESL